MTIKELADVAGVSQDTIRRVGKKYFPGMHTRGIKVHYTEKQSNFIMQEVKKKNMVSTLTQNAEVKQQSAEVDYEIIGKMIGMAVSAAMTPIVQELRQINSKPSLQIEQPKQDYFSLVAYCSINKIKVSMSELKKMGMDLRKMSKADGKELHKVPDERWGEVNSYPIEILEEYFSE